MRTRRVDNFSDATQPGDYFKSGDYVFLNCPYCGHFYDVTKWLVQLEPLTLHPSVRDLDRGCHFHITNGEVIPA